MTRDTNQERIRALRDELWSGLDDKPGLALTDAVLERFKTDSRRYSDILEWSFSEDEHGIDMARFSYAFPGYAHARGEVTRSVLDWAGRVGDAAEDAADNVMRAARHPAVEQVLMGYASGAGGSRRVKFYLQFRSSAGPGALEVAHALLGSRRASGSEDLPLHLLGLDVGESGLSGAKLYFVQAGSGPCFDAWPRALVNTLRIHRMREPDDPGFTVPTEIDFSLAENDLSWSELTASPLMAPFARAGDRFGELQTRFSLRPRRVSLGLGTAPKLNVYYVLDESITRMQASPQRSAFS